jgi:hypothetical protein
MLVDVVKRGWAALFGPRRYPTRPKPEFRRAVKLGREIGQSIPDGESPPRQDAVDPSAVNADYQQAKAKHRAAYRCRKLVRGYRSARLRAAALRSEVARMGRHADYDLAGLDFLVASTAAYVGTLVAVVMVLESAGTITSLQVFDATLGWLLNPMAIGAGGILVLAGHGIGHLVWEARERGATRNAMLAGAAVIVVLGALAIFVMGPARDANMRAGGLRQQAAQKRGDARKLDDQADAAMAPRLSSGRRAKVPTAQRREADALRSDADKLLTEADELDRDANDLRTLTFFRELQMLGLGVGAVGGFFFARGGAKRLGRRLNKRSTKADKLDAAALERKNQGRRLVFEEVQFAHELVAELDLERALAAQAAMPHAALDLHVDAITEEIFGDTDPGAVQTFDEPNHKGDPRNVPNPFAEQEI